MGDERRERAAERPPEGLVREAVRESGLLDGVATLVAMLSGGRDSICLLDVAVALLGASRVRALHVNYGLRDAAAGDERHCLALCERLGVELTVVRAAQAPGPGEGNLQAWARELRYEAAERLARECGAGALIATGHTASDQVETILYRLAASPGRRALLGMAASEGRLVRPLLSVSRVQTAEYCQARGLAWREDESNEDERFARVRVREMLVSALRRVHPAAEANVLRTARLLGEEAQVLDELVERELRPGSGAGKGPGEERGSPGEPGPGGEPRAGGEPKPGGERGPSIAMGRLAELSPALARLVVVRLAELAAGGYVPQAGERVDELLALARRGGRAELHLGGLACAVLEGGVLSARRLEPHETSMRSSGAPPRRD